MASSSSLSSHLPKYEVFLSFRGADTRDNFISHLYAELGRKNINAFIDNKLDKGHEISPELYKAIEDSMIYVIIFSPNYASSRWCLDELTKILECKEKYKRDLIPVFYKVDPSTVRHQKTGSYADAFVKHEKRFPEEVTQNWKDALTKVADLTGWDSNITSPESMLVDAIVKDILRKLDTSFSSDYAPGMVGIDEHIAQVQSLLQLESAGVRIIGIWGMGGIGKTTLARALYDKLGIQFGSRSCVINAQQEIERVGIDCLRKQYLSELLEEDIPSNGLHFAIKRLTRAKVLLILDDVKKSSQIQELIGGRQNFGQGSRIIVTSRDMQVLKNAEADRIYQVKEMNYQDSLQLFNLNAFKQNCPVEVNADLVGKVLEYARGIPLALKVLGTLLCGRAEKAWDSELQKLEKLPDDEIFNVLKLSYDGLNKEQKDIFLDITCFYAGGFVDEVVEMLDGCGFSVDIGVDVLKDRCLISTLKDHTGVDVLKGRRLLSILEDRIMVHDLMLEMGIEIIRQQCVNDPGKRSHLWNHDEIYHVLKKNKGTDAIQCIFLDMCRIKSVELHPKNFKSMPNLRMLYFHMYSSFGEGKSNVNLPAFLESLPDGLKFLHWDEFPLRSLPLEFCPENLVKLEMRHSHLEQFWEGDQELPNLKRLDLSDSSNLIRIPDISNFPNIEEIILIGCARLIQVYSSSFLSKLKCLWLNGCVELTSLNIPSNILSKSSGLVGLYNCCKLKTFSINGSEVVESHGRSDFDGFSRAIEIYDDAKFCRTTHPKGTYGYPEINGRRPDEKYYLQFFRGSIPSRFSHELCWLDLGNCESLTSLPFDLCKLKLLRRLHLSGCPNLENFPEIKETMENLALLDLEGTTIQELPSSLHRLVGLEVLSLHNCWRLKSIPSSIGTLTKICKLDLTYCKSLETLPSSIFKLRLTKLDLNGCSMLKTFPEILEPVESVAYMSLTQTAVKELPSSLDCLVGLQTLRLDQCRDLESLPNCIGNLNILSELYCSGCVKLTEIPNDIGRLSSLKKLSLQDTGIINLPESIAHLSSLESLDVSYSRKLECIPQLPPFLKKLLAFDCPSIRRMMPNSGFKLQPDSKEGIFKLFFTYNEEQDHPRAHSDVVADARRRINEDAYRFVFYCFPGCAVPDWFPCRSEGNSIIVDKDSLNWSSDNRLIGFAMCVILRLEKNYDAQNLINYFRCRLSFESDGHRYIIPNGNQLNDSFSLSYYQMGYVEHTFLWKHYLMDSASIDKGTFQAHNFTFDVKGRREWLDFKLYPEVKECGICPLYTKEKDDNGGGVDTDKTYSSYPKFSNNCFEERIWRSPRLW